MQRPWYLDAIFYQVYTRAFRDSNGDGIGDFQGLVSKLDHVRSLGADCIWLMPHYPSPMRDDGYDVADFYQTNPHYGTLEDFGQLVAACHERGLRIITDLVLNHVSRKSHWFKEYVMGTAPMRDYFIEADPKADWSQVVRPRNLPLLTQTQTRD